jgi:hypothetical protein
LYSSEGQGFGEQEGNNIQRTLWRNTIIEKANTYLIPPSPLKLMVDQQH